MTTNLFSDTNDNKHPFCSLFRDTLLLCLFTLLEIIPLLSPLIDTQHGNKILSANFQSVRVRVCVCLFLCVCVCVVCMFMWFMRTQMYIMTWV